jgi:hypothetical protein
MGSIFQTAKIGSETQVVIQHATHKALVAALQHWRSGSDRHGWTAGASNRLTLAAARGGAH